jgi:carboxypeptidase D
MHLNIPLVLVLFAPVFLLADRSPLKVEKDTAVYQLLSHYHNYTDLKDLLNEWVSNYAKIAQLFSVGKTYSGKELLVMRLTSPLTDNTKEEHDEFLLLKPKFKWIANMHGDETIGREMMIALIYHLLLNSKSDSRINRLLSTTDIYIMPTMNPVD